jgi:hypothetical protein
MALTFNNRLTLLADQYFPTGGTKTGISLHHTVGGFAASTVDWWKRDGQMVGVAFIIDRDGTIYQVFDPKAWAYQFGLKWGDPDRVNFEKRFIGIEIASEGALIESGGNLYSFGVVSSKTLKPQSEAFDYGQLYRGFRYFDKYEAAQIDSVVQLVDSLLTTYNIERNIPKNYIGYYGQNLKDFRGVLGHVNVREDKSDPMPDNSFWQRVINDCHLQLIDIGSTTMGGATGMTTDQVQKLFQENLAQFSIMNVAAGSMVKGLLWELQDGDRNTYIRLRSAEDQGYVIYYDMVQGDPNLVPLAAQSLGFKSWANNRLEVYNA